MTKQFFEQQCAYYNEPIINTKTGKIFKDMYSCYKQDHSFDYYKLIMDTQYIYQLLNKDKLEYPLGNGTTPPHATIKDVHDGIASVIIHV